MSRVAVARTTPSYAGLEAPFHPGKAYPELAALLGDAGADGSPNGAYAAVRAALYGLGLDAGNFGSAAWNPLGALVERGEHVVLKPNFIRHFNPCESGSEDSLVTHGSIVRASADYALLAVGPEGTVTLAEAPQHDCDWERIRELAGLEALARFYDEALGFELEVIDLRREQVLYRDGVIVERRSLPGDPRGYRLIDLAERSAFEGSGLDPRRFRGADYDPGPTCEHHMDGRNEYLISETVLAADLVVNLPKLKTHKKTGVTLALKNLVGINGDKNLLPHHCFGPPEEGGDEYPASSWIDRVRSRLFDRVRPLLQRGVGTRFFRAVRRLETAARGDAFVRNGNWHRNRTTWRMCLDLNRCLYYSDVSGSHFDAPGPVRRVLTLLDGIVAGEGEGPLAPRDRPLGVVMAALDPLALDLAAVRTMGFDERRIPKVWKAMRDEGLRVSAVHDPEEVEVYELRAADCEIRRSSLDALRVDASFLAHSGWRGHVERESA